MGDKPFGRPTLYRPEYCAKLIEHMRSGLSFESFAGTIEVGRAVLYDWCKRHPDFLDAKNIGQELSLLFWEKKGIYGLEAEKFQSSLYIFTMKARFKWADQLVLKNEKEDEEKERLKKMSLPELLALIKEQTIEE